jgi:hypothetical protein
MTLKTNSRVAGVTFLVYIAAGLTSLIRDPGGLIGILLSFVECFSALVLGITLYAITREQDRDLAMLGMACRIGEGLLGAMSLATKTGTMLVGATFFAVGSTCFCWLFLRGRLIPTALAWLGLFASVLLVVTLPIDLAGMLPRILAQTIWLPMLAFEVPLGIWLTFKGVGSSYAMKTST